jgi:hypothetical protein
MLHKVPERTMHWIRWALALGWFLLIFSLLYDPITPHFTDPSNLISPFRLKQELNFDPEQCVKIREVCIVQEPYAMGALVWWAMIVPAGIFILLVFGHEFWRRICPLSFVSQIPRALGIQRRRNIADPITGEIRSELVTIGEHSWLGRNHLYVQSGLFVLGLGARILFVNSDRISLFVFLIFSIFCAILVGYLYAGKSWCNYFCPMAPVQSVYTGPRALLGSQAHLEQRPAITQSMCRTVDPHSGLERSACVSCKTPCIDIDAEKTYWGEFQKPGRRLVQYGYLGMVIAFYLYYFLYAGNWDYYFTGLWTHEADQVAKAFDIGFFIYGHAIPIPKFFAVFITFAVLVAITVSLGNILEKLYRRYRAWQGYTTSAEQTQHIVFTLFTISSFWTFFAYGARPWINRMSPAFILSVNAVVIAVGAMWMFRTFGRTHAQYNRESMAISLRKQLQRLNIDSSLLDGRSLQELSADEVYTLVKVLPEFSQKLRLEIYSGIVQDLLEQNLTDVAGSIDFCRKLRQELQVKDSDHFAAIEAIAVSHPEVLISAYTQKSTAQIHNAKTLAITAAKTVDVQTSHPTTAHPKSSSNARNKQRN